jgi:hypothetical protein
MVYFYELKQGRYEWVESVLLVSSFDIPPEEFRRLIEETIAETPEWKMAGSHYHPDVEYLAKRLIARSDYDFKRVRPRLRVLCKGERWKQEFEVILSDDAAKEGD